MPRTTRSPLNRVNLVNRVNRVNLGIHQARTR